MSEGCGEDALEVGGLLEGENNERSGDCEPEDVPAVVGFHVLGWDMTHYGAVAGGRGGAFLRVGAKIDTQNEEECKENAGSNL